MCQFLALSSLEVYRQYMTCNIIVTNSNTCINFTIDPKIMRSDQNDLGAGSQPVDPDDKLDRLGWTGLDIKSQSP